MIYEFIKSNRIFFFLCFLTVLFQLFLLDKYPRVLLDEPWYANTLYNLATEYQLKNNLFGSGGGDLLFLYPLLGAIWTKIVGFSFFKLRLFSVFIECGALFLFLKCLTKLTRGVTAESAYYMLFAGALFILNNNFFILFRRIRPEGLSLLFLVAALYYYISWIQDSKKSLLLFGSGVMIMLGFMSHPNVIIYGVLLGIFILYDQVKTKQLYSILYYMAGCLGTFLVFIGLFSLFSDQNYISLFFQPGVTNRAVGGLSNLVQNMVKFSVFYSMGIKRLYVFLFEIIVLIIPFFYFTKRRDLIRLASLSLIGLFFSFSMLSPFFRTHFCYTVLFSCLIYMGIVTDLKWKRYSKWVLFCGIVYLLNNAMGNGFVLYQNRHNDSVFQIKEKIEKITEFDLTNKIITGPAYFWFFSPDNYSVTRYSELTDDYFEKRIDFYPDIVVEAPIFLSDISPTTGQSNKGLWYPKDYSFSQNNLNLIGYTKHSIVTNGYDTIYIWEKN
jgi:hypothetical protein